MQGGRLGRAVDVGRQGQWLETSYLWEMVEMVALGTQVPPVIAQWAGTGGETNGVDTLG